ncbi:MAG: hypothetical protein SFZ03_10585 [Candidatus Melainabacteria bacterium]|nr:hypothetical protein [Candidatus Melainabacteria bacterium]
MTHPKPVLSFQTPANVEFNQAKRGSELAQDGFAGTLRATSTVSNFPPSFGKQATTPNIAVHESSWQNAESPFIMFNHKKNFSIAPIVREKEGDGLLTWREGGLSHVLYVKPNGSDVEHYQAMYKQFNQDGTLAQPVFKGNLADVSDRLGFDLSEFRNCLGSG